MIGDMIGNMIGRSEGTAVLGLRFIERAEEGVEQKLDELGRVGGFVTDLTLVWIEVAAPTRHSMTIPSCRHWRAYNGGSLDWGVALEYPGLPLHDVIGHTRTIINIWGRNEYLNAHLPENENWIYRQVDCVAASL
jgi:hypothetical protein